MQTTQRHLITGFIAATFLTYASAASGVVLTFATEADYTDNFVQVRNTGTAMAHNAGAGQDGEAGYVSGAHSNTMSMWRYDTDAGDGTPVTNAFLNETVSFDIRVSSIESTNSGSYGLFLRIQEPGIDTGVLALFTPISANSVQLRLFYGAQIDPANAGTGTNFFNTTFDISVATGSGNPIAANSWLHFEVTQGLGPDADSDLDLDSVFNLTISDAQGLVATTGDVALTDTDTYDAAGAIGTRFSRNGSTITTSIDNFSIVPEPNAAALLLMGAGMATAIRRRMKPVAFQL